MYYHFFTYSSNPVHYLDKIHSTDELKQRLVAVWCAQGWYLGQGTCFNTGHALKQTSLMMQLINGAKDVTYVCPLCRHFEHTCDKCEHYSEQKLTQLIW